MPDRRVLASLLLASSLLATGCVRRIHDNRRAPIIDALAQAEKLLAAGDFEGAQEKTAWAYRDLKSTLGGGEKDVSEVADADPEMFDRIIAVDTALNEVLNAAPTSLPEFARRGDLAAIRKHEQFLSRRRPVTAMREMVMSRASNAFKEGCAAAFEVFLSKGNDSGAAEVVQHTDYDFANVARELVSGRPGCERLAKGLAALRGARSSDVPSSLRRLFIARAPDCAAQLERDDGSGGEVLAAAARTTRTELGRLGNAVPAEQVSSLETSLAAFEERAIKARAEAEAARKVAQAQREAADQATAAAKAAADAERERQLAPVRAELAKAAGRKDLAKVCALSRQHDLPVPDSLRGPELAALAIWEAHRKQSQTATLPASAWLHALWLKASGERADLSAPAAAKAWSEPISAPSWDWRDVVFDEDCFPMDAHPEPGAWRVQGLRCAPDDGRVVTTDVIQQTVVITQRLRNDGRVELVRETQNKKVGVERSMLNATTGAVTVTVEAPFAHQKLGLQVTRSMQNISGETEKGFAFALMRLGSKGAPAYSLLGDLQARYLAEIENLKIAWRAAAAQPGTPQDEREEALARVALLEKKDPVALKYFKEKYQLTGDDLRTLKLPEIPRTCP